MKRSAYPTSDPNWGFTYQDLELTPGRANKKDREKLESMLVTVLAAAGRVLTARARDQLGSTSEETACLFEIKAAHKEGMLALRDCYESVLAWEPMKVYVDPTLTTWETLTKYRDSLASELVHRVRRFVLAIFAFRERLGEANATKGALLQAKNKPAVNKTKHNFFQSLENVSEYIQTNNLRGSGAPMAERDKAALQRLIGHLPRADIARCALTNVVIQGWSTGEGGYRYANPDEAYVYHLKDVHDMVMGVKAKAESAPHYPGLAEACYVELRRLGDDIVGGHWTIETSIPARLRTMRFAQARTPAELFSLAVAAFSGRLCVGVPTRLAPHVTLGPQAGLVPHKGFSWLTYGRLHHLSTHFAECFRSFVGRGTVMAVACVPGMTRLEYYIADFAATLAGCVVVPLHAHLRKVEDLIIKWFVRWTVRAVICHERDVEFYREVVKSVPVLRHLIVITDKTNDELRDEHPRKRGHTLHSMRTLCGCDPPPPTPTFTSASDGGGDGDGKSSDGAPPQPPPPDVEIVRHSVLEAPEDQPKPGKSSFAAIQLTAGPPPWGSNPPSYPPKAVVFSSERLLATVAVKTTQPLILPSFSPWSSGLERFRIWDAIANGGRFGVVKYVSDRRVRAEDRARRAALGEEVVDSDAETVVEEEEEETKVVDDLESLESLAQTTDDDASTTEEEEEEEEEEEVIPPTEEELDPLAHTLDGFTDWWGETLSDVQALAPTEFEAPLRVWDRVADSYVSRRREMEEQIRKGEQALATLERIALWESWEDKQAADLALMRIEDDLSFRMCRGDPEEIERKRKEREDARKAAEASRGLKRGVSSSAADMLMAVQLKVAAKALEGDDKERPPTPPQGKWRRHQVKPHHTAAKETRQMLGSQIHQFTVIGPGPTSDTLASINKALWPKSVDVVYSTTETGVIARNNHPVHGTTVSVERVKGLKETVEEADDDGTYRLVQQGQLVIKSFVTSEVSRGYYRQPKTTGATLDLKRGVFKTGDVGTKTVVDDSTLLSLRHHLEVTELDAVEDPPDDE